jgi:hypothetical protein
MDHDLYTSAGILPAGWPEMGSLWRFVFNFFIVQAEI